MFKKAPAKVAKKDAEDLQKYLVAARAEYDAEGKVGEVRQGQLCALSPGKKRGVGQFVGGTVPSLVSPRWVLRKAFQASIGGSAPPPPRRPISAHTHLSRLLSFPCATGQKQSKTSYTFIFCSPPLAKGTLLAPSPVKRLVDCVSDTTSLPASSHTALHPSTPHRSPPLSTPVSPCASTE